MSHKFPLASMHTDTTGGATGTVGCRVSSNCNNDATVKNMM